MMVRERPLIYAHLGDLHLTGPGETNALDLVAIVDELSTFGSQIDFVFLPGDNADDGLHEQYDLARRLLLPLAVPVHVITGDHDMANGTLDPFYAKLGAAKLPMACDAAGVRCLFLDLSGPGGGGPDFRLGARQQGWLRDELEAVTAADRRCAVFMHTYPADLRGHDETARINEMLASRAVLLVDMGHTHYNELANDGRTIFAATRSTGQVEEGPVGYSLVAIDNRAVSWRFREAGTPGPVVLLTAPVDRRLAIDAGDRDHAPRGAAVKVRASVLGREPIESCSCRLDDGEPVPMQSVGPGRYEVDVRVPLDARNLRIEARAAGGGVGAEAIELADDGHFSADRFADGSDADAIGTWLERGILGTQLGPNRNGRQW